MTNWRARLRGLVSGGKEWQQKVEGEEEDDWQEEEWQQRVDEAD